MFAAFKQHRNRTSKGANWSSGEEIDPCTVPIRLIQDNMGLVEFAQLVENAPII